MGKNTTMDTSIKKVNSPEEEELELKRAELANISELLAGKELELTTLRNSVLHFERRYLKEVGIKYVELDEINAQIAEKIARQNPQDTVFQEESENARETANSTAKEFHSHEIPKEEFSRDFKPSEEIKKLYRQIAIKIHPDKSVNESDREYRTKLMAEVNDAYANGDIERLRQILHEWESSPESVIGEGIAVDLVRMIRSISQIKGRLKTIEREVEIIKETEIYGMMMQVQEAEKEGSDLLKELSAKIDSDIKLAKERLKGLS
ncbi:MAG: molecular chaperone DnaJ [Nitrospinae bacterium]|nr:molecular chaperone DnaJ [Nitrospinota bacterium]